MGKRVSASNSVVSSVEQAAAIYGVRSYRMQSRVFDVVGTGGISRPMFIGLWRDRFGDSHKGGMPDLLLTPKVPFVNTFNGVLAMSVAVALWVECKSGGASLTPQQRLFRDDAIEAGAFWIQARDSAQAVIDWFDQYGVKR